MSSIVFILVCYYACAAKVMPEKIWETVTLFLLEIALFYCASPNAYNVLRMALYLGNALLNCPQMFVLIGKCACRCWDSFILRSSVWWRLEEELDQYWLLLRTFIFKFAVTVENYGWKIKSYIFIIAYMILKWELAFDNSVAGDYFWEEVAEPYCLPPQLLYNGNNRYFCRTFLNH